ncbi:DUF4099 domain-containing protein [Pedobacter paludis]|uniref:DUF4099 domain-containing protein n=1 Tax=Pedobacter paludis TaxID=2203212 RepID=A0A317F5A6_9SPHI|nr:DUF4099 domain-containing protein [Pedobacter paludis]PWS32676.1 hypothetical protein DF947_06285 [Pedobacter paludis]
MKTLFEHRELPLEDFRKVGLLSGDRIALDPYDLNALLFGRRTSPITLNNLEANGFKIEKIDLKLSLDRTPDGALSLALHPIYKRPQYHKLLEDYEADSLLDASISNIVKVYQGGEKKGVEAVIEYDAQTRSFIAYDPRQIEAPFAINGITLDEHQAKDFRLGAIVDLGDGTKFQHRASEALGLLSNRSALIFSHGNTGPFQHTLIRDISGFPSSKDRQLHYSSPAFQDALKEYNPANYAAIADANHVDEYRETWMKPKR